MYLNINNRRLYKRYCKEHKTADMSYVSYVAVPVMSLCYASS